MRRFFVGASAFCMTFALLSTLCAAAQELAGKGEWQSLSVELTRGTWSVDLKRSGSTVEGSIKLTGSNVFRDASVSGTIDGQQVVLGVMAEGTKQATFSGKLEGEKVSGEWQFPALKDEGVWFGTLGAKESDS